MKKYFFKETGDELPVELEEMENIGEIIKELLESGVIIEKDDEERKPIDFSNDEEPDDAPDNEEEEDEEEEEEYTFSNALLDYVDNLDKVLVAMTDEIISLNDKISKLEKSVSSMKKSVDSLATCTSTADPHSWYVFSAPHRERTITIF